MVEKVERIKDDLIDRVMDMDNMVFYDDAHAKVKELSRLLKYFWLTLDNIYLPKG